MFVDLTSLQTTATYELSIFGIDKMDEGTESDEVAVENSSKIAMNFTEHGIYVIAYAIDEKNNQKKISQLQPSRLRINWQESDANELCHCRLICTNNGGENPSMIEVSRKSRTLA